MVNGNNEKSLVGKFFHAINNDGVVTWQGQIVGVAPFGRYFVQLYEWIVGSESCQMMVRIEDMNGWAFYDTAEDMKGYWESSLKYKFSPKKEKKDVL